MTAAVAAAVMFYVGATLPRPPMTLDGPVPAVHAPGAYHVHSIRSDGTGTVDEIAAAAAAAGLTFVIFTDHGDGTSPPEPPSYRHGVLCIDALEVSTEGGHLVALGLQAPTPYPLGGRARDVIEDIHRSGGAAVIAHPDSPKADLRWRGQNAPFDGIEWLNADAEWRDDSSVRLIGAAIRSLIRPEGAIASLFDRPVRTLQRWDSAAAARPVFGLAAVDVHARIGWREIEDPTAWTIVERPSYRALFGTLAQVAILERPLTGEPGTDATLVLGALTRGRSFSIVRALAGPAALEFLAWQGDRQAGPGDRLPVGETIFRARLPGASGARMVLLHNGRPVAAGHGLVEHQTAAPGAYRIEGMFPNADVPWVMSNPIVIGNVGGRGAPPPAPRVADDSRVVAVPPDANEWTIEREPTSEGRLVSAGDALQFDYRLGPGPPRGQYAALVNGIRREGGINRVQFTARASRPMRVSVQVRLPGGSDGQRWRHSVFLDTTARPIAIRLEDFEPVDTATTRRPIAASVQTLLFVVDTVNTAPGSAGRVWISDVRLGLAEP